MASYMNSGLVFLQAGAASASAVPWRLGQEENDIVSVENLMLANFPLFLLFSQTGWRHVLSGGVSFPPTLGL